jgi:signal peptidase I
MQLTVLLADPSVRFAGAGRSTRRVSAPTRVSLARLKLRWGWAGLAAVVVIAVGCIGFLQTWPPLATVMSASMTPTIKTGDMVVLKRLNRPAQVGDIVSISVPEDVRARLGYPPVVIHRIVKIDPDGTVITKGDAHDQPDPFSVPRASLTTVVVATVPAAGRLLAFLGSGLGLIWLAGGALLLIGMPLLDHFRDGQRRELDERDDMRSALQSVSEELTLLRADRVQERQDLLEQFAVQIERAVASAVAASAPPPAPPPPLPRGPFGCVPASQWKPPTPDVMSILRPPKSASEVFRLPADFVPALTR